MTPKSLADEMIGSASLLSEEAEARICNDPEFAEDFYALCFECSICGWWTGEDEKNIDPFHEVICSDCVE